MKKGIHKAFFLEVIQIQDLHSNSLYQHNWYIGIKVPNQMAHVHPEDEF